MSVSNLLLTDLTIFELVRDIKINILTSFITIGFKMPSREKGFPKIWPSDLLFPDMTKFHTFQDFIKTNILTKLHDCQAGNVPSTVHKGFSKI